MRLALSRSKVPAQRTDEPVVVRLPYELVETDGRLDLHCTLCHRSIACGVHPDRLAEDGPFFVDAHAPYCLRVSR
jgi:hypothetical protein